MGLLSNLIAYKIGRRRGRIQARRMDAEAPEPDRRDSECLNFESFCREFGDCNGMECEYAE